MSEYDNYLFFLWKNYYQNMSFLSNKFIFSIVVLLVIPHQNVSASTCSLLGMSVFWKTRRSYWFFGFCFEIKKNPVPNIQALGVVRVNRSYSWRKIIKFECLFLIVFGYCGSYAGSCLPYTTARTTTTTQSPSRYTDFSNGAVVAIIVLPIFFCIIFCGCYASSRQQRQNTSDTSPNTNSRIRLSQHRIDPVLAPPPIPTFYEDAPPSYETAVASLPPKTPPFTANVDRTNL